MTDPNSPDYRSPITKALGYLKTAEAADRDILNGRNVNDALEEKEASIRIAIHTLEQALESEKGGS